MFAIIVFLLLADIIVYNHNSGFTYKYNMTRKKRPSILIVDISKVSREMKNEKGTLKINYWIHIVVHGYI